MELDLMLDDSSYDFDFYIEKLNQELLKKEAEIEKEKLLSFFWMLKFIQGKS